MATATQTPAKKIELRNVKHAAFASEETECFEAAVYIDGVKKGIVSNEGHGGCHNWHPFELQREIEELVKSLPPIEAYGTKLDMDAELYIGGLLTDWLIERDLKRLLARKLIFTKADGKVYGAKIPQGASYESATKFLEKAGAVQCLNRMPFEQALEIYKKAVAV